MHISDKNIWIAPLLDPRVQLIVIPNSSVPADLQRKSLSEQVKTLMMDIDESKIIKHNHLVIPSFKIEVKNEELNTNMTSI